MTGFKSGATDSGLDDDDDDAPEEQLQDDESDSQPVDTETETSSSTSGGIPWLYKRNSITDGRAKTVQLHLQQSTLRREQDAKMTVPIDDTVNKADLREAAYLIGLEHLDDVADLLREWGYDAE